MKIALISPKGRFFRDDGKFEDEWKELSSHSVYRNFWSGLSTGLLTIAALTPKTFKLVLIDENHDLVDFEERFDLVGITAMTQQATRAYEIADVFRSKGIKVVIGGIHASTMAEEAKKHADAVIIGEAENLWGKFLKDFIDGNIKPFYKDSAAVDLSISPIPRYDLVKHRYYNTVWVQTTRGCPIDCEFCAASKVYGFKFRHKEVKQVVDEIKYISKLWGYNVLISFADDNIFIDKKYATELVESFMGLNIRWLAQTDISIGKDEKFLKLIRKSGCSYLFIGFETVDKEGLLSLDKSNWKYRHAGSYIATIKRIQSQGIGILGAFILGLDSHTTAAFRQTADFINENHIFAAQLTILTPLPETRLRERLKKEKRLLDNSWDDYTFLKANYIPKNMSIKELNEGLAETYRLVYNPERNLERIKYFKNIYIKLADKSEL